MINEKPTNRTRIPILKIDGPTERTITMACDEPFSFHAHWLGKRSFMCPGTSCPACDQHIGARWLGLVFVEIHQKDKRYNARGIIELSEAAYFRLRDLAVQLGNEIGPGLTFNAWRTSKRHPLRFGQPPVSQVAPSDVKSIEMVTLADAAATYYGLPAVAEGETVPAWSSRVEETARSIIRRQLQTLFD